MQKIQNMRIVSDKQIEFGIEHYSAFTPVTIGTVETIDGVEMRAIDNWKTVIQTWEHVNPTKKHLAVLHLPDGTEMVIRGFETHDEAHDFINKAWLGAS